jgi:hypothetical protein
VSSPASLPAKFILTGAAAAGKMKDYRPRPTRQRVHHVRCVIALAMYISIPGDRYVRGAHSRLIRNSPRIVMHAPVSLALDGQKKREAIMWRGMELHHQQPGNPCRHPALHTSGQHAFVHLRTCIYMQAGRQEVFPPQAEPFFRAQRT